ncbi:dipeptidyl aminopeptidase/acylaminoacyl peptidase [Luteimonas cucumeris]|uniref:Dipeptidyl aminopeptidase/acylaminoacyl peptidase n=1 Tax=Luteimonas cucumeris TaxID=985012 RepID=A0A562L1W6_9GAMM|nr:S9 family peptidase [Luteimonas cucumeris]TWI01623.1 dipeptidyl aminopeptidase/acylaminoacyl peptidase [Luteimonas cucumeris]
MQKLLLPALLLLAAPLWAQPATPLTMDRIMADPDWIGPPVEDAWWSWDGRHAQYELKRDGGNIRDIYQQGIDGGSAVRIDGAARADLDAGGAVYDAARTRMAYIRNDDVFVRDLRSGTLTQLTRGNDKEALPQWSRDGGLVWRVDNDWYRWDARDGVIQAAVLKAEDDPAKPPKADDLRERQLRYLETLRNDRDRREAVRRQDDERRRADPTRAAAPVYLGKDVVIHDSALSPDGRWLLVVTHAKDGEAGQEGQMPKYVTESGYEEFEEVRTRVGRNPPLPHTLWLVEIATGQPSELKFDALPGIARDPLAAMRAAAKQEPLKGNRDVRIETDSDGDGPAIHWGDDSRNVAVLVRAVDNKDRWIATVDLAKATLQARHHLHDDAWINWTFNDFGWLGDGRTLWYLSEQSGWSHLYVSDGSGGPRALTQGHWEVSAPVLAADGRGFYFLCNRQWPGDYEVCAVDADGGAVREVTALDGVESFVLSPDGGKLLVRHSDSYTPPQLAVVGRDGDGVRLLTDTRTPEFKAIADWVQPEFVQVPSTHGAGTIWGKYYGPKQLGPGRKYPVVMFVHGAGYLQNVSARYPNYFREQMFHNLLVQRGYVVIDLDYRASEGYGRDWRTAIYRQMGHPELDDYLDGLDWIVANRQGDRDRAGIYGGSYGGFMTFMALFRKPGVFKAGAALRPVADWSQYNHEYTSNILNTPELDPEAYRKSSPMEYAAGLQDHLLIAHGMIDDNVFFRDSVVLTQKLIELRKDKWEIAPYPLERHSFVHPDAWYDEYRRIYELFERTLK